MNKSVLFFLLLVAQATMAQTIPQGSKTELKNFQDSAGTPLPEQYTEVLPELVHKKIISEANELIKSLNNQCRDSMHVTFGPRITTDSNSSIVNFENGFVKIEALKCFGGTADPKSLIEISSSSDFKKKAFSTLEKITENGDEDCEWTNAPKVGRSHYCYQNVLIESSSNAQTQASFLTYNDKQAYAPVYFRETLESSRRMGSSTLFYSVSYVRSTEFTSVMKVFAPGFIQNSQNKFFKIMETTLSGEGTNQ